MINSKNTFVFLFSMILFSSCANSTLEVAPWNNAPVPVIYSVITPGQAAKVYVNRTYNQAFPVVANPYPEAKVYMCGPDSNWVELPRISPDTTMFEDTQKHLNVEMGKTYMLKVLLKDKIVRAHTSIPAKPGIIKDATCQIVQSYTDSHTSMGINGETVSANINSITVHFEQNLDADSGYYLSLISPDYQNWVSPVSGLVYHDIRFATPQDSTAATLYLLKIDAYYLKYILAQSIASATQIYDGNSPIFSMLQSFGGVMPQFSNIQNGVGLFGNYVVDKKRIEIKPLKN